MSAREDNTCTCGPLHLKQFHEIPHQHAPYTEVCTEGCCIVDNCPCPGFRSLADEAERQGVARAAEAGYGL